MDLDTLPKRLVAMAARHGDRRVALREKDYGIWQEITWAGYRDRVRDFCLGLLSLGFERGERVAIVGDNRPEWVIAELAAQSAGGASVGVYQDSLAHEVAYVVDHADATIVVVEDQEQVDKILEVRDRLPKVKRVIYYDPKGLRGYRDPWLAYFPDVEEAGRQYGRRHPGLFEELVAATRGEDTAIVCYTSGTTGAPKGAMLSHRNLISMGDRIQEVDPLEPEDQFLSFLPLAWIGEQMTAVAMHLAVGFTVNFPEEPDTVQENLREIGPHVMFSPPRIWEDLVTRVQVRIADSSPLKRWLFHRFMPVAYRVADARFQHRAVPLKDRVLRALGEFLVFSAIKDHLGLLRLKRAYTGGAALGPDVFRFYHALGVNLKQIYGQTEIVGIAVLHRDDDIRFHTVGKPLPGGEMAISPEGEILLRSPAVFQGYYKNPEATEKALEGGWLHTGDAGYIEEDSGHLVVIDRLKDVMRLADGSVFSPQFLENKLKFSPYIKEAVALGQGRSFVTAMINIDLQSVGHWAETRGIAYTTYQDLSQKDEVLALIRSEVERINQELPPSARVRRFVILHKELDADDEELTRTRKLRRGFIHEKYAPVIEGLYEGRTHIPVQSRVRYRDGREALIETILKVQDLAPPASLPGQPASQVPPGRAAGEAV
ncbi:long-chain fatty acid--CoA ligase [Caldinitratiruptor microaerophilus]|uniref:Acyl-CoA synthetase n=1 Tax=Caldinitratiruptor microaerophilus TaxID=671077 RepID=A0AA35CN47_9FIRM|nr:long-chain fatty acid--CoA ligase [Caldinitratiruptor microaerophilus]BDG61438.1 long-chain-fatty-acid--CoA ligase [Caldinitratiruptor microaerophilus]